VDGTSTGSTIHVILSDSEESSGWSRLLRFFVACRLLRMTVNGESLNLGNSKILKLAPTLRSDYFSPEKWLQKEAEPLCAQCDDFEPRETPENS
jgi:hypothetical protein